MIGLGRRALPAVWLGLVAVSMAALVRDQMTPGAAGQSPSRQWPAAAQLRRDAGRLTLVMFLHPQCPCSRATLNELAVVMSRAGGDLDARVLMVLPRSAPDGFAQSDLMRQAAAIPGVRVGIDKDAHDARAFGAATSGDVSVFSSAGDLVFKGGITDGRGHEGDNAGLDAVLDIVFGRKPLIDRSPVFGCPLEN